ncbi:MAG TPA: TIGR04283 family arsenosugar biosynthesis glycosyltransferase [Blastocatellia bacterium]|jgi:rSAM/selenodomain-associated transferase 2|nr:TIGR04283 family arsenosugar biosynthesis glycosyltransferase [Blastocatellia bacterium]
MKISVIIPALNEADNIASCVGSVENQEGDFEIIVVDGGSTDGTAELVSSRARVIASERGRAAQMNEGARKASGDAFLFLHADSRLHPHALAHLRKALADSRVAGGTFTLKFDSEEFLLRFYAAFTRLKFRYFHFGDQGIFVRRGAFEQLGGYKQMPLMEDMDFLARLRGLGRVALIDLPVTTSARRFLKRGPLQQQLLNIFLVSCYLLGVKPSTLSRFYGAHSRAAPAPHRSSSKPSRD